MLTNDELKKMKEIDILRIIKDPNTSEMDYNRAANFIVDKYTPMIHKHWWTLQKQLANSSYVEAAKDEYYGEAYAALFNAIQKANIDRVYDDKFKILQLANWYISNVRKKIIKQIIKKDAKTKSLSTMTSSVDEESNIVDPDVEKAYNESNGYKNNPEYQYALKEGEYNCDKSVKACLKRWDKTEKKVYRMLKKGMTRTEISRTLKIKPDIIKSMTFKMYEDLKKELDYDNVMYSMSNYC